MNVLKKSDRRCGALTVLLLGMVSASAHAATIKQTFESTILDTHTSMHPTEFKLSAPGELVIVPNDVKWPSLLDTLSFSFTDATHGQLTFSSSKSVAKMTWVFDATTLGNPFAWRPWETGKGFWHDEGRHYGHDEGRHHDHDDCQVAPVPLPAAAWFLFSGIASLAAFRPKRQLS